MIVVKTLGTRKTIKGIKIAAPGITTSVIMALKIEIISEEITTMEDLTERNHETLNLEMIAITTAEMRLMMRNMNQIS